MAIIVMNVEGVLTDSPPNVNILTYEACGSGRVLYNMLRDSSRIVLLSLDHSKERVQAWMARERMTRYADIHCYPTDSILSPSEWRVQHLKDMIGIGHHISFYIDSDPATVGNALGAGINAILVAQAGDVPGKNEKGQAYSPWYDLVETIEQQSLIKAARGIEDDTDG
jgi:hypothetical protein